MMRLHSCRIFQWEQDFDALIEIALASSRRCRDRSRHAAIFKIEDAAVLEETAYDAAHADAAAEPANARDQHALASHDEIDFHAGL